MTDIRRRCAELLARREGSERARAHELFDLAWQRTIAEHPEYATVMGADGDHTAWTDQSLDAYERQTGDVRAIAEVAAAIDDTALDEEDRLNLRLFRREVEQQVEGATHPGHLLITSTGGPHVNAMNLLPMTPEAARFDRLRRLPEYVEGVVGRLREGMRIGVTASRVVLESMPDQLAAFASPRENPLSTVVAGADDVIEREVAPAFGRFRSFLVDEYLPRARLDVGWSSMPDGDAWYAFLARKFTTTSLTPKEIHDIGLSEVARIRSEMESVVASADFDGTIEEFFQFLRTDDRFFFERAEDLLATYRDIAKRADPQLVKMFGVLPRTPYGVEEVPEAMAPRQTTAYYILGSLEAGRAGTFFANTYDLRARPKWEMEALTLHEAVPGHHLQLALAQEMGDVPQFRRGSFVTAFIEGWGLYAESLGPEMGFYTDPYSKFGQLTYEMWRAIRLVVDTGIHALGWSRDQAIELFVQNAGKALHDTSVEVDRYISWPGQALAYKIGELKFKELRARAVAALGDRFDVRAFHDALLRRGALPLDVLDSLIDEWLRARGDGTAAARA